MRNMERKNQVYLSAFIMYVIAGFAGAIYALTKNYWMILLLAALVAGFTAVSVANKDTATLKETKFSWISVAALLAVETIYAILVEAARLPFKGFFLYFYYLGQIAGFVLMGYAIVRLVLEKTSVVETTKELWNRKHDKAEKLEVKTETENNVGSQIEDAIAEETANQDAANSEDVEIVESTEETIKENSQEPEIIGIELQEASNEVVTPYMEEEL